MSEDIQILPVKDGEFVFTVLGKSDDTGFMLLQRVFTLLLTTNDAYRPSTASTTLLKFLEGANYPPDGVMDSVIAVCCSQVLSQLDDSDRARIASLTGMFVEKKIQCTLTFTDGTKLTGAIDV